LLKNNKILPAISACCGVVVKNECMNHFPKQKNNQKNVSDASKLPKKKWFLLAPGGKHTGSPLFFLCILYLFSFATESELSVRIEGKSFGYSIFMYFLVLILKF
jgi:hypothetical protein